METKTATRARAILVDILDSTVGPSMIRTIISRVVTTLAVLASRDRHEDSTVDVRILAQVHDGDQI